MLVLGQPEPFLVCTNAGPRASWADIRNRYIYKLKKYKPAGDLNGGEGVVLGLAHIQVGEVSFRYKQGDWLSS